MLLNYVLKNLFAVLAAFSVRNVSGIFYFNSSLCESTYNNTPVANSQSSPPGSAPEEVNISLSTTDFPSWSVDGPCHCLFTSRSHNTTLQFDFDFHWQAEADKCVAIVLKYSFHTFYVCPDSSVDQQMAAQRYTTFALRTGRTIDLELYNPQASRVKANINVIANMPNMVIECRRSNTISVPDNYCPCNGNYSTVELMYPETVPTSQRLLVGFMSAIAFLICVGVILLVVYLCKRGYFERFDFINCIKSNKAKEEKKTKKFETDGAYATINYNNQGRQNPGFQGDSPHRLIRTPQHKSIDGIYATVNLSIGSHSKLPMTPDANLGLDLKTPTDCEVGSRYRGSTDSGLYSELSIDNRPTGSGKSRNQSFPGPYATSLETLQSLGPEYKFEPPAGQSSPKLPTPRSKEEIEALYAKPVKKNKRKKLNSTGNMDKQKPGKTPGSLQELNSSVQLSVEKLPEYYPRPMGSRSGSSSIFTNPMPGSRSGSVNVLNLNKSRSDNEIYVTDGTGSRGSTMTIETDV